MPATLRKLLAEHPEWADLPIVIYREDGRYDYVGMPRSTVPDGAGMVYQDFDNEKGETFGNDKATYKTEKEWEAHSTKVLVFSPN